MFTSERVYRDSIFMAQCNQTILPKGKQLNHGNIRIKGNKQAKSVCIKQNEDSKLKLRVEAAYFYCDKHRKRHTDN